jgi:prevent-host-death family protein
MKTEVHDMNTIIPVSDLQNHLSDISKMVHETKKPVFLTQDGYGDMVLLSMESYEKMQFDYEVYAKLLAAEQEEQQTPVRYSLQDARQAVRKI